MPSIAVTDEAATLVDEIYYANQDIGNTGKKKPSQKGSTHSSQASDISSSDGNSEEDRVSSDQSSYAIALYLNWPNSFRLLVLQALALNVRRVF